MFKSSTGSASAGSAALASLERKLSGGAPDDPAIPATVRKAVRLMLAGAAVTAVFGVFEVVVWIASRNSLTDNNGKQISSTQFTGNVAFILLSYAIIVALWLLMARQNRAGQGWARIAASVLLAVWSYSTINAVSSLRNGITITWFGLVTLIVTFVIWGIGIGAVTMLWRRPSSDYFKSRSARTR